MNDSRTTKKQTLTARKIASRHAGPFKIPSLDPSKPFIQSVFQRTNFQVIHASFNPSLHIQFYPTVYPAHAIL